MDGDKDKGVIEKAIEAVEDFATDVKEAAKHMMDSPGPLKPGDEVIMMPVLDDGMFGTPVTPQFMVIHHRKKPRAKKASKKNAKAAVKKAAKKKTATKASPKKKSKAKSTAKKTTKKTTRKKKTKKSRR